MSDTLVINEIYLSLQGESTFAGLPCIFIRLTACNLRCSYCDTAYAFTEGKKQSLEDIRAEVNRLAEPFHHQIPIGNDISHTASTSHSLPRQSRKTSRSRKSRPTKRRFPVRNWLSASLPMLCPCGSKSRCTKSSGRRLSEVSETKYSMTSRQTLALLRAYESRNVTFIEPD